MGQPAARITDTVAHVGSAILQGCSKTFIGNLAAAHVTHEVIHKGVTVFIAQGSGSVNIENQPAARLGDMVSCGDPISSGCTSVHIGG
jgi:uncharacterized Zn-binding protein involved in type VI secretion